MNPIHILENKKSELEQELTAVRSLRNELSKSVVEANKREGELIEGLIEYEQSINQLRFLKLQAQRLQAVNRGATQDQAAERPQEKST